MRNLFSLILPISMSLFITASAVPQTSAVLTPDCNVNDRLDDSVCLQNALSNLPNGQILSLQEGTYFYSKQLFLSGKQDVVVQGNNTTLHATHLKDQALTVQDSNNVRVTGLHFTTDAWQREQADRSSCLLSYRSDGVEFDNNLIEFCAGAGIHIAQSTTNYKLHDNEIHDSFADGIHQTSCSNNGEIFDNLIYATGDDAIASVGYERNGCQLDNINIHHNEIMSTRWGRGITIEGTKNAVVDSNYIRQSDAAGIFVTSSNTGNYVHLHNENVVISNNLLQYCNTNAAGENTIHGGIYLNGRVGYENRNVSLLNNNVFDTVNGSAHIRINTFNIDIVVENNQISDLQYQRPPFRWSVEADVVFEDNTYNGRPAP